MLYNDVTLYNILILYYILDIVYLWNFIKFGIIMDMRYYELVLLMLLILRFIYICITW